MEFNKVSKRATGIVAAMILIGWFALAARSGNVPQLGDFEIYAASMVESGKAEVRLRWIMKSGWLPEGACPLMVNLRSLACKSEVSLAWSSVDRGVATFKELLQPLAIIA